MLLLQSIENDLINDQMTIAINLHEIENFSSKPLEKPRIQDKITRSSRA